MFRNITTNKKSIKGSLTLLLHTSSSLCAKGHVCVYNVINPLIKTQIFCSAHTRKQLITHPLNYYLKNSLLLYIINFVINFIHRIIMFEHATHIYTHSAGLPFIIFIAIFLVIRLKCM